MKFFGGFITGVIATVLVMVLIYTVKKTDGETLKSDETLSGFTRFPEKGECISTNGKIEIFQVLKPNIALAKFGQFPDDLMVLLINYEGKAYYDNQKIKVNAKTCARQIGTYQYSTRMDIDKTVPVVVIE